MPTLGWLVVAGVLASATVGLLWARRHLLLVSVVGPQHGADAAPG
ncbi:hypothetical protein ABT346_17360 [Micromonospora peucetia]